MPNEKDNKPLERIKEIIHWTLTGMTMYYRDSNLDQDIIDKYEVGKIFRSETFVDVSIYAEKPISNCRFVFASSKAARFQINPATEKWGLHSINCNSYFKVLDVYKKDKVTQIFLIHIPYKGIDFFNQPLSKLSEQHIKEVITQNIETAREHLNQKIQSKIAVDLNEKEWIGRTGFPIGLDNKNEFFSLEPTAPLMSMAVPIHSAIKNMTNDLTDLNEAPILKKTGKNIVICLDGTGNQYGENLSNVVKLFRMLERKPGKQVAYYDPGVGTMGDPEYKTFVARKINKGLGLAFGRGLMKNLIEAYTFLMEHYEKDDKVFIFGFSRGAYTARALAAFIKNIGMLDRGAKNLLPYAMRLFLEKAPTKKGEQQTDFHRLRSRFRSTYGRTFNQEGDPLYPGLKGKANYQLRIHFLGLFDTVKSYGWIRNPVVLRNEKENASVLNVRHAISIDERRSFFRQMHWHASKGSQSCKEVWFAGDHSDVGGGYKEEESGLAKISLEWMVHEAISFGMKVVPKQYGHVLQKERDEQNNWVPRPVMEENEGKYSRPNKFAMAHKSLKNGWWPVQLLPKKLEPWEDSKGMRTIKSEKERLDTKKERNPFLVHQSVIDRILNKDKIKFKGKVIEYEPKNLWSLIKPLLEEDIEKEPKNFWSLIRTLFKKEPKNLKSLIKNLPKKYIEETKSTEQVFNSKRT